MASSLNVSLPDELRDFVNLRANSDGFYATPSEYMRDLIRRDMETQSVVQHVINGVEDVKQGRMSQKSILDIGEEE